MSYNPNNPNGQATSANSAPVVIASDQSGVPISASSLPLPTGAATSANQTNASQKTQVVDGSGNVIGSTSNALDVNIKSGGSSGGVSAADEAAWTAGTTVFAPTGGVFNDSAAALTSGQEGTVRLTNNRGVHANLRSSAGTELATSGNPLRIDPTGTTTQPVSGTVSVNALPSGSNTIGGVELVDSGGTNKASISAGGAVKVDGSAVTQPISGTVTANAGTNLNTSALALESGGNLATLAGAVSASKVNVNIASGNPTSIIANAGTNLNTSALALDTSVNGLLTAQGSTTSGQSGPLAQAATTTAAPTYTTGKTNPLSTDTSGNLRTSVNNTVTVSGTVTTTPPSNASVNLNQVGGSAVALGQTTMSGSIPVTLASNQSAFSDNITQFGGTNVSTGTGASGAGIPRVTVSNDSNVLATQSGTWTVQPGNTPNTTPWLVSLSPSTSGGWSTAAYNGTGGSPALTNTVVAVKASAGQFGGYMFYNSNSSAVYIQVFNAATGSVTLGTTNPTYVIPLPANGAANVEFANGIAHGTAISVAVTTTASGSTAPTTALNGFILFK